MGAPTPNELADRARVSSIRPRYGHQLTVRETRTPGGKKRWLITCSCGWKFGGTCRTREIAEKQSIIQHLDHLKPPCPYPGKRKYRTQEAAESDMHHFWATGGRGKVMPCRVYLCSCGRWHMTSKPLRTRERGEEPAD